MSMIEVERIEEGGLSRKVWRFHASIGYSLPATLRVSFYGLETRPSTRHKWRSEPATRYTSDDPRRYNSGIEAKDVPLPNDVAAEAKDILMRSIVVTGPLIRDVR